MGMLEGQRTLITGGGSGIGRAVVERFCDEGARVGVLELESEKVEALATAHPDVVGIIGDVRSFEDNQRAVHSVIEAFGGLDVLIGNAGVFDGGRGLVDMEIEQIGPAFDELFGVNVKAYLLAAKAALPHLVDSRGTMIFTASFAGLHSAGGGTLYTASKHAVVGVIRQLAYELAPMVKVVGVSPGVAETTMHGVAALGQTLLESKFPGVEEMLPIQFLPSAEDYAGSYAFLASRRDSRVMTGTVLNAYNGLHIRGVRTVSGWRGMPDPNGRAAAESEASGE